MSGGRGADAFGFRQRWLLLAMMMTAMRLSGAVAAADPHKQESDSKGLGMDYAAARRGEFLSAQYQRAVELEAEAMNLAASGRFQEADESLALAVRIHEQLVGSRHPQLLRPLLAKAENAAVWGDRLGMQGLPQVTLAKELVERSIRILSATPPTTQEHMEEESVRLTELSKVVDQMIDALSPPNGLPSPVAATELSELPHPIRRVHPGEFVAGSLNRTVKWAYFGCPVYENWVHAHTESSEKDAQVTVYGIQTVTTASLITHESRVELFASVASPGRLVAGQSGNGSTFDCRWWHDSECAKAFTPQDFARGGGKGVAVGRQLHSRDAPMWFHFMELPAEAGHIALLAARLSSPAARRYSFMLQVHEDPIIPLHLGEGVQTWELDGFRASVHYFPWGRNTHLHSLEMEDLGCPLPSDARLLVSWDSIPWTSSETLRHSQQCVESRGQTNRLAPGGCWADGASDSGRTLFVVVLNPCPDPTKYTMVAKWGNNGDSLLPRASAFDPTEGVPGYQAHSKHLREHRAQEHMPGIFVPTAKSEAWPGPAARAVLERLLFFCQAGLVPIVFVLALSTLYTMLSSWLNNVRCGAVASPGQRRRLGGCLAVPPLWKLPTLAELSGARSSRSTERDAISGLSQQSGRGTAGAAHVSHTASQPSETSQGQPLAADPAIPPTPGIGITSETLRVRRVSPVGPSHQAVMPQEINTPGPAIDTGNTARAAIVSSAAQITEADSKFPQIYFCPITQELMRDPVFASDGYTYERAAIAKWLRKSLKSPMTNLPLARQDLVPNHMLRSAIQEAQEAYQAASNCY